MTTNNEGEKACCCISYERGVTPCLCGCHQNKLTKQTLIEDNKRLQEEVAKARKEEKERCLTEITEAKKSWEKRWDKMPRDTITSKEVVSAFFNVAIEAIEGKFTGTSNICGYPVCGKEDCQNHSVGVWKKIDPLIP